MANKRIVHEDLVSKGLPRKGQMNQEQNQNAISEDMKKVAEAKNKLVGKLKESLFPKVKEGAPVIYHAKTNLKSYLGGFVGSESVKKIFTFLVVTLIILIVGLTGFNTVKNFLGGDKTEEGKQAANPTIPYQPYQPSIYAEDEMVLILEEDVKVIDREISNDYLRETSLIPPTLDFDISFTE